jgi:hypothetical protein
MKLSIIPTLKLGNTIDYNVVCSDVLERSSWFVFIEPAYFIVSELQGIGKSRSFNGLSCLTFVLGSF